MIGILKRPIVTEKMTALQEKGVYAFEVERDPDGRVVIYVPGAPDPFAGAVMLMSADRIERLDVKFAAALKNIRKLGRGTGELLRATAGSGRS